MAPGANIGYDISIFEAVHGSAPDIAGKNLANPCAMTLAGAMMLEHLGETNAAERIRSAVATVVKESKKVTRDLNPEKHVGTTEMTDAIIEKLRGD